MIAGAEVYNQLKRGSIEIEPNVWQMVAVPARWGKWAFDQQGSLVFSDRFDGVDGTPLSAHTSDSGDVWTDFNTSPGPTLNSGVAVGGNVSQVAIDGAPDRRVRWRFVRLPGSTSVVNLIVYVAFEDFSNYIKVFYEPDKNWVRVYSYANGAYNFLRQLSSLAGLGLAPDYMEIDAHIVGTNMDLYVTSSLSGTTYQTESTGITVPTFPGRDMAVAVDVDTLAGLDSIDVWRMGTLVRDDPLGTAVQARVKQYVVDQLEAKYGVGVVTVANAYPGDEDRFLSFVPGSTPAGSEHNFPLMYLDPQAGQYEALGFWIKSNHGSPMTLEYVEWR